MLNLVCRDTVMKADVIGRVKQVFESVFSQSIDEEVNEIIIGVKNVTLRDKTLDAAEQTTQSQSVATDSANSQDHMVKTFVEQCQIINKLLQKQSVDKLDIDLVSLIEKMSMI